MSLGPPPFRSPLVDSAGMLARPWQQWLDALWRRTGGATDLDTTGSTDLFSSDGTGTALAQVQTMAVEQASSASVQASVTAQENALGALALAVATAAVSSSTPAAADTLLALLAEPLAWVGPLTRAMDDATLLAHYPPVVPAVSLHPLLSLIDGVTAPGATVGKATLYVDTADGDLKVIFGDGTVKTIVSDT